jgi:D,D-heptose 1,7-bisphosphate phosphatase
MKQAVILAGGLGTRLKSVSGVLPKAMVSLNGKPIIEHMINVCINHGFNNIHLILSHKSELIIDYLGNDENLNQNISYTLEDYPRGTFNALIQALPHLESEFLLLYGDTYLDVDLSEFWNFHSKHDGAVTLLVHPNDHPHDSDIVELGEDACVKKIHPYPHGDKWLPNLVNAAAYVFNRLILENHVSSENLRDIVKDFFPVLLNKKVKLYGYETSEYIKDAGTPSRLLKIESDINSGRVQAMQRAALKPAIFFDRDGTINEEVGLITNPRLLKLIGKASTAISKVNSAGFLAILVTNQPVIARGDIDEAALQRIHYKLVTLLGREGAYLDKIYFCPHHPDSGFEGEVKELKFFCDCRKPNAGMIFQAKKDLNIDLRKSYFIGDSTSDILAAQNAGLKSILVDTGLGGKDKKYALQPDYKVADIYEAVNLILESTINDLG